MLTPEQIAARAAECTKHQAGREWRAEFHAIGMSSRFWIIRGFRECGQVDVFGDVVSECDAARIVDALNAPTDEQFMAALGPCGK